jgi:hypothetical protein
MPLLQCGNCFVGVLRLHCHSQAWVGLSFKAQLDGAATIVQHNHLLVPSILHGCTSSSSARVLLLLLLLMSLHQLLLLQAISRSQQAGAVMQGAAWWAQPEC